LVLSPQKIALNDVDKGEIFERHKMTPQEVFDKIVSHLRSQGKPSIGKHGGCKYRNEQNCKCAVGCLIEDDEYSPKMEGLVIFDLIKMEHDFIPETLKKRLEPHATLLNNLMQVHDFRSVELWEPSFQGIAKEFSLTYTPPKKES
jgi:hypothetical protein